MARARIDYPHRWDFKKPHNTVGEERRKEPVVRCRTARRPNGGHRQDIARGRICIRAPLAAQPNA
eukprot:8343471-Lingulodinium_polyedra.AAC.1